MSKRRRLFQGMYASSWLPTALSGLKLWLRPSIGIGLVSGAVSQWTDQSGQANNPVQATAGQRPTYNANGGSNNMAYLSFVRGSSQCLISTAAAIGPTTWTIMSVHQFSSTSAANGDYCFSFGSGVEGNCFRLDTAVNRNVQARGVADREDGTGTTNWEIWVATNDGTTTVLWVNGVQQSALTNATTNAATSGNAVNVGTDPDQGVFFTGNFSEGAAWNRALAAAEITQLSRYAGDIYAIAVP